MSGKVFMVDADNRLTALVQTAYDSEDLFQRLLADHPAVLSDVSGPGEGGALLLIRREAPVPEQLAGSGRWSLDHLFVDQDAVPVLVEIKRSTDTRARREVVAQMLDYAATALPIGRSSIWSMASTPLPLPQARFRKSGLLNFSGQGAGRLLETG